MFEQDKYIERLLESFVKEGTYDKDFDIPSEEEINSGGMTTIYRCAHASQIKNIFKNGYSRAFCASNDGSWYGDGVYCNVKLSQAIIGCKTLDPSREEGRKYGSTIISNKLIGGFKRFLIFDEEIARKIYGARWKIEDQVKQLFNQSDAERVWKDMLYIMSISSSAKQLYHGRTAQLLQDMFHNRRGRISRFEYDKIFKANNIRGAIYTGGNDGLCAVVYDFSAVIPFAITTDYAKTWKKLFNMEEFEHRMATKIDVNQRFDGKYKKVFPPVATVDSEGNTTSLSLVLKFNGKYNYIDPKTGEEILPIDFDSLTAFNKEDGTCQAEYRGRVFNICIEGFENPEDGEWYEWESFDEALSLTESSNVIRMILREAIDEGTYGEYDIPTEKDLDRTGNGEMVSVYHVSASGNIKSIFKVGIHRDFNARNGNCFGKGAYSAIYPEQSRELLGSSYGDVMIQCKLIGGFRGFIVFDKHMQRRLFHREIPVYEQLLKYVDRHVAEKIYQVVGEHNAGRLQWACESNRVTSIRGAIYDWGGGFIVALPFDFTCLIPYAISRDGKHFTKRFDEGTLDFMYTNADVEFRYVYSGKYKSAKKPVIAPIIDENGNKVGLTGYSLVKKNNGKYNYVNIQTNEEILPFDFDSLTAVNRETGEFQGEYNGEIYNLCDAGFENPEDGEWYEWESFLEVANKK